VDTEHFGTFLKRRREARGLSIADVSRATKIKEQALAALEEARLDALPALVFVRGYISAYAREVGADESDVLRRYRDYVESRDGEGAAVVRPAVPASGEPLTVKSILYTLRGLDDEGSARAPAQRRVGVVMVVLLILVVATLTLSLLLRHGGAGRSGLSQTSVGVDSGDRAQAVRVV
jgi:cytoskeletal protein RodZ